MNRKLMLAAALACSLSTPAWSQTTTPCPCGSGTLVESQSALTALLNNRTVCAVLGNERWQEWHSGTAFFELGDNFANPPQTGTWAASGTGSATLVTYSYSGGGTYRYNVCQDGGSVHFCGASLGGRNITNATLLDNKAQCSAAQATSLRPTLSNLPGRVSGRTN